MSRSCGIRVAENIRINLEEGVSKLVVKSSALSVTKNLFTPPKFPITLLY